MNLTIGQRISARGEDFIITSTNVNHDGTWLIEAEGISELVKGRRFMLDTGLDKDIKPLDPDMNRQTADYALVAGVRLADLQIRSAIRLDPTGTSLDKAEWEYFWQVYNLVQDYVGNQGM